jgi:hypothetical protein
MSSLGLDQVAPHGFGWMVVPSDIIPCEKYYKKHRVQIWKLPYSYRGTWGHFLIVDTAYNAIIGVVQSDNKCCWYQATDKRDAYIKFLETQLVCT